MRIDLVDPSAFTPPYDRALAAALARAPAPTTSRWSPAASPTARSRPREGFAVDERFYRLAAPRRGRLAARLAAKLAEHVPEMVAYRAARRARPTSCTSSG